LFRDPLTIATLIAAITALAFWLDRRYTLFARLGASMLVIIFGAVLSNTGIVPHSSPVYRGIEGSVTSLAIIYLLLGVRLGDLGRAGPMMLALFVVASIGTAAGAFVGALIFSDAIGPLTWKLAGTFTGTYTGGSLNFAAVGRGLELPASTFAAAAAADNVTTAIWMGVTLLAPVSLLRPASAAAPAAHHDSGNSAPHPFWGAVPISLADLVSLAAIGFAVLTAAAWLGTNVGLVPEILWLTTIALALAQLPAVRRINGAMQLGNLGLHLFFAVIGIRSLLGAMLAAGPAVFLYTLVVVAIHGIFLYSIGRALRATLPTIAVASQAAIGGPSTAMAVAAARGWPGLTLPGVAVGLLGYALGNYAGFGVAYLVRAILGG
jgi:uncharacterized membrane protein